MQARSLKDIFQSVSQSHQFIIWLADHFPSPINPESQTRQNQIALMITYNKYMQYKAQEAQLHHIDKQKVEKFEEESKQQKKQEQQHLMDHLSMEGRKKDAERIAQLLQRLEDLLNSCKRFIEEQTKKVIELYSNHEYTGPAEKTYGFKDGDGKILECRVPLLELHDFVKAEMLRPDENNQSRLERALLAENPIEAVQLSELELVKDFLREHVLTPAIEARDGLVAGVEDAVEKILDASASLVQGIAQTISSGLNSVVEAETAKIVTMNDQKDSVTSAYQHTQSLKVDNESSNQSISSNDDDFDMIGGIILEAENSQKDAVGVADQISPEDQKNHISVKS